MGFHLFELQRHGIKSFTFLVLEFNIDSEVRDGTAPIVVKFGHHEVTTRCM